MTHPHLRTRRLGCLLVVGAVAAVLVAACSSAKPKASAARPFNPLSSTTSTSRNDPDALHLPSGFQLPDTRFVSLLPANGKAQPAPAIPVTGGKATVEGTVTGPSGPVAGATVRIERWVGTASGAILVATDGGGHYAAGNLLGGHYKVRAWLQPSLTTFTAATGFVADNGRLAANLGLNQYNSFEVQVAATSGVATVGQAFTVEALVTQQTVDGNGVVQAAPVANVSAQLATDPSVAITGADPATTGANGLATWGLTCSTPGGFTASVTTPNGSATAPLPACQAAATTPTTQPPPVVLALPVGQAFTVPNGGPYPAGVYATTSASCSVTWQVYVNGLWQPGQSTGLDMILTGPGRNFAAAPGTPNCTYTRLS